MISKLLTAFLMATASFASEKCMNDDDYVALQVIEVQFLDSAIENVTLATVGYDKENLGLSADCDTCFKLATATIDGDTNCNTGIEVSTNGTNWRNETSNSCYYAMDLVYQGCLGGWFNSSTGIQATTNCTNVEMAEAIDCWWYLPYGDVEVYNTTIVEAYNQCSKAVIQAADPECAVCLGSYSFIGSPPSALIASCHNSTTNMMGASCSEEEVAEIMDSCPLDRPYSIWVWPGAANFDSGDSGAEEIASQWVCRQEQFLKVSEMCQSCLVDMETYLEVGWDNYRLKFLRESRFGTSWLNYTADVCFYGTVDYPTSPFNGTFPLPAPTPAPPTAPTPAAPTAPTPAAPTAPTPTSGGSVETAGPICVGAVVALMVASFV